MTDEQYMARAMTLAARAVGQTYPNPMVGAVVVKDGRIIGEGYHHKAGEPHAEVHALRAAGEAAKGATLYVTLEPCAHYGKTPPCAKRVIEAGIARVVVSVVDTNPLVAGKGIAMLKAAGIEVTTGVLEKECSVLIEGFLSYIKTKRPFVTLKSAMSLDGKIATRTGESQWITNEMARRDGHILRATHDAIVVGIGTVLADNPTLTARVSYEEVEAALTKGLTAYGADVTSGLPAETAVKVHQPDVLVLDSLGRTPTDANLLKGLSNEQSRKVHIFVSDRCEAHEIERLQRAGALVHVVNGHDGHVDIEEFLQIAGEIGYTSILVEGGSRIISAFVKANLFNKIITYIGNILIGGKDALSAMAGEGVDYLKDAPVLQFKTVELIDNNVRIEAYQQERSDT
ncbi:MAG: bifunctional diaminohydroxyphosphoribosylaminopyrimidine deaminase/5-amino-6-(5-phosphoribosylamino)uracil reductase RibD [Veillonella sp.]|uniref:bifunctional diaminohydroxyphosphoribosylaminopyrimidine deaminase/5-amino-6-(5-phosphoribosylamino)uracil reductase RibD n=1 Tax=Veillonella sp. TaxID=1926307 RepID=UPI0025EC84EE|nr:bifunctional diaminohydroxyphosphoribosylaminopyrimidine deaminase/5-amino-6-(5-phosphoribosylamino)uracil reductase RibD [Veillonella sp.]MBS4912791.1 bifunctional diaminohydroxyphosphoribosylaminopyrimidine deaminase/5-amino-6-(5-phosphoribosylamino)uracil reductase RibD [Veillonella sp.]